VRATRIIVAGLFVLLIGGVRAEGQGPPARGIFGSSVGSPPQTLTGAISLGAGFFRTTGLSDQPDVPDRTSEGFLNVVSAGANYNVSGRKAGLSAGFASGGRYYADLADGTMVAGHRGSVNVSYRPTTRLSLGAGQSVSYQPAFRTTFTSLLNPTGNLHIPDEVDLDVLERHILTYVSSANLRQSLSQRSSLSASASHRRSEYDADRVQVSNSAGVRYSHGLAEGLSARLGYRYTNSMLMNSGRPATEIHTVDAGLAFGRTLPLSEETTFGFNTGSVITRSTRSGTRARLTGNARLNHQMGRSWTTFAYVGRNVGVVDGLTDVVISDHAGAGIAGQLSRAVRVTASTSATRGQHGEGPGANHFIGYGGNATLSVAVSRIVGLASGYTYRRSEFDRDEPLLGVRFREYHRAWSGVSIRPWAYVGFSTFYSYTHSNRSVPSGSTGFRQFNQHAAVASVNVGAPLYTRVSR
jgi:hypothetical protein